MKKLEFSFNNGWLAIGAIFLVSIFTYLPSLAGTFLHTDDWFWSYWGGFSCSGVVNWILPIGRPLAGLIYCVFPLVSKFGSMWVFRLLNILNITVVGFLLWKWMVRWKIEGYIAFLVSVLTISLPAFQVFSSYISTIPHCMGLLPSFLAVFCVDEALNAPKLMHKKSLIVFSILLLIVAFSLNQASALYYVGVLLIPILMSDTKTFFKIWPRKLSVFFSVLFASMVIYYSMFRLSAVFFNFRNVGKYDGRNFVTNYIERARWFFHNPFYEASNLWAINPTALLMTVILLLMAGLVIVDFFRETKKLEVLSKYVVAFSLFPLGYGISLVSSDPSKEYRTYAVLGSSFIFFLFIGLYSIQIRHFSGRTKQGICVLFSVLAIMASIVSHKTVAEYFVLSDSAEFRFVKNEVRKYLATGRELKAIHIIVAQGAIAAPRQRNEIGEPTLRHTPNVEPLIWAALESCGYLSRPRVTTGQTLTDQNWVEVVFNHNTIDLWQKSYSPSSEGVLVIDISTFRFI